MLSPFVRLFSCSVAAWALLVVGAIPAFAQKDKAAKPRSARSEYLFVDTLRIQYRPDRDFIFSENADPKADSLQQVVEADLDSIDRAADQVYIPKVSIALLQDRLSCLENQIPLTVNPRVAGFIDYFTVRNRNYTQTMLERREYYFPLFERKLKEHGLPDELKYLAVVESGLNYAALSRAGALGLWQFMPGTGRDYGLYQDFFRDERMDPERATEAACRYLKRLHRMFNDWELALASYNAGPGRIIQAQRRTGKRHFWDIYNALPVETRAYVPQFVALTYALNYPHLHNIYPDADSMLVVTNNIDSVLVDQCLDLEKLAAATGCNYQTLRLLNPVLRRHATPINQQYMLKMPKEAAFAYLTSRDQIEDTIGVTYAKLQAFYSKTKGSKAQLAALKTKAKPKPEPVHIDKTAKPADSLLATNGTPVTTVANTKTSKEVKEAEEEEDDQPIQVQGRKRFYKVRKGDNLTLIARKHNVEVDELREWNGLKHGQLRYGQMLTIYAPAAVAPKAELAVLKKKAKAPAKQRFYTVQPGDTLWAITRKYDGLTVDELVRMNRLHDRRIVPGQKLIVGT